jgi:hypothetical protein
MVKSDAAIPQWSERADVLFAFSVCNWIALVDPIGSEILRDIENLHIGEPHVVKRLVCGSYIGATAPGAATAIEIETFFRTTRILSSALYASQLGRRGICGIHGAGQDVPNLRSKR